MQIDITAVVQALFALAVTLITAFVIPYIKRITGDEKWAQLQGWVKIAVTAAEQIYAGPGRGEEKKAYVLMWLSERGVKLDGETLDALIESAVWTLKGES